MVKIKDYYRKNYSNPFFKKLKNGSVARGRGFYYGRGRSHFAPLRKRLVFLLLLAALGGWIYFLFYAPYFEIKKIEIYGLEKVNPEEIRNILHSQISSRRFLIFKQKNIFWFDEKFAEKNINTKYVFQFLKIDKNLPDILRIELKEKAPILIWRTGEKFYEVDQGGTIIHELTTEEVNASFRDATVMPTILDESNQEVNIKDTVIPETFVQFIIDLSKVLPEKTNIQIANFKLANRKAEMIKVSTMEGWEVYFANDKNLISQIEKLNVFLKDKKVEERKKFEYIDLRFEDRVYYK